MDVRDVHRAIAKLDEDVVVQEITPQNVIDQRGATISERLLRTVRGGFG